MASEIGTGCIPAGSRPTMTTVPPRTAPLMADASPWWFPEDSTTTSASTASIASASSAFRTSSAPTARAISSGRSCMSTATIRARAGALEDGHRQGPDGAAADDQRRLASHLSGPRDGVPGDGGRFRQGSGPQLQPRRQRPEHPGRQCGVAAERTVGVRVTGRAAQVGAAGGKVRPVFRVPGGAGTRGGRVHRDGGAGPGSRAVRRGLDHGSDDLVAQHHGRLEHGLPRRAMHPVMQVRAADPAEGHFDKRFIGSRHRYRHVLDPQVARRVGHHRCGPCREHCCAAHQTTTVIPPSTKIVCPLTKFDPSEASHTAGPARSWTVPHRWAGVRPRIHELKASSSTRFWVISVWM